MLAELGNFFREICSTTLDKRVVKRLKKDIAVIMCKLEPIYPPALFDVMVHLAVHLPDEALHRGPVQYGWMYPIECRLCTFKGTVRNKARAEGCIAEAYIAAEASTFWSRFISDLKNGSNQDGSDENAKKSVFTHKVDLQGNIVNRELTQSEREKLTWCVLDNAQEADEFVK